MASPFTSVIQVTMCDPDGLNPRPGWVNINAVEVVQSWNLPVAAIEEVRTTSGLVFYMVTGSAVP